MAAAAVMRAFMAVLQFCSAAGRAVGHWGSVVHRARQCRREPDRPSWTPKVFGSKRSLMVSIFTSACCTSRLARGNASG